MDRIEPPAANGSGDPTARIPDLAPRDPLPLADRQADADTFARLLARHHPPAPDPGFVAHLEDDLMTASTVSVLAGIRPGPGAGLGARGAARISSMLPQFATAALVLLTLVAAIASLGTTRSARRAEPPGAVPTAGLAVASPALGNGIAAFVWESAGDPDSPLSNVGHLAIDPAGNVWASDPGHDRFQIFSPDGAFLEAWGTAGSGDGQFSFRADFPLAAVAFAADGGFYVIDGGNHRVQKFAPDRSFVTAWGTQGNGPGQFGFPIGIAVDRDGRVYVLDGGRHDIQVFDADGAFLRTFGGFGSADGQFLLSNGGEVAVDPAGNVWVSDASNNRIQVFSPDGDLVSVLRGGPRDDQLGSPVQVAFDDAGRVFVASADTREIQVFAIDGTYLGAWGKTDAAVTDIDLEPGTLLAPVGIAVDGAGGVYVADVYRDRVSKFRLLPLLQATPGA